MMAFRLCHVFVLAFLKYIDGQRRIKDGIDVIGAKRFMVYLVQARSSIRNYDSWICGGSILNRWYILTSAACVEDVKAMYAISGTRRYVKSKNIYKNNCTKHTKKKIVFTCVPKEYEFSFSKIKKWSLNDIAIVKVETPYDFKDDLYDAHCDYRPDYIKVNYDLKKEAKGTDVIVIGFGHRNYWRPTDIGDNWNQPVMRYTATRIYNKKKCMNLYKSPNLFNNIDKYMFCTNGTGRIDETGQRLKLNGSRPRRTSRLTRKNINIQMKLQTRKQGFCQNDHGGPLVAWIDDEETVMGVASVFRVNNTNRKCIGPYLYTSTARNEMFIECIINDQMTRRSSVCDQPAREKGFTILRRYILWNESEDHVANNEEIRIRPQINMNFVGMG